MGKCSDGNKPYTFSLTDLADLGVNDTKEMDKGCGPHVDGTAGGSGYAYLKGQGFGWPENGEFEWGGLGDSCGLCSADWGCQCSGDKAVIGKKGKVKRTVFKGDPKECCFQNSSAKNSTKIVNGLTCAPKYRDPSNSECNAFFLEYCSGDKIVNDQKCINLKNTNSTLYNQLMTNHCNASASNANTSNCIDWCKSNMSSCTMLGTLNDCTKFNIPQSTCTPQAVNSLKNNCITYGMLSEQGLPVGSYPCTGDGIDSFQKACKLYDLIPGTTCTANALDNAKLQDQNERLSKDATEQSQQQFDATRKILDQVVNLPTAPPPSPADSGTSNKIYYIVAIIVVLLVLLSSTSGLFVAFDD